MNSAGPLEHDSALGRALARQNVQRRLNIVAVLLCVGGLVLLVLWVLYNVRSTAAGREMVLQRWQEISIGDDIDRVRNIIAKDGLRALNEISLDFDLIRYDSPPTFGARNWTLLVMVDEGRVTGLGVRCADSNQMHPRDAPPDRIADGHESAWYASAGGSF